MAAPVGVYDVQLDDVAQLIREAYQQYRPSFPRGLWERFLADIVDVRSRLDSADLIVAEVRGRMVGSVTFYPDGSRSAVEGWPSGWAGIRLLAVHPDARGRGIGRALMNECIRRSRAMGSQVLGLHTTRAMDVARRMYERMGFVRVPEYDFHPSPGVVVMAYRLDLWSASTPVQRTAYRWP